jgi:hypothetical protein
LQISGLLWLSLIFFVFVGCANGPSHMPTVASLFGNASPSPVPIASATATAAPVAAASPLAAEPKGHAGKKTGGQARAASENAATASRDAANASAAAALASKQAASVANQIEGKGPSNNDISLETDPGPAPTATPRPFGKATLDAPASAGTSGMALAYNAHASPAVSTSALESSGSSAEGDPATAAKLIQDIDKIVKRVDRKNLSADDTQRDMLAQKLLQEAKRALAEGDNVAATSLATKASTLLAPLPKLASTTIPARP